MDVLNDHLPDLNLITWYAESNRSFLSRVSPWTKGITLVLLVLLITVTRSPLVLAGVFAAILIIYRIAGFSLRQLSRWYLLPIVFVVSIIGIMIWNEPGPALISIPLGLTTLNLSMNGLVLLVTLVLKTLIMVTYSLLFLMTTRYLHLTTMVYRVFPDPLNQIFLMSYRFIFLTLSLLTALLKSVQSRGGGLIQSARKQGTIFAEIFGLVFIRSFDQAERVNGAMRARGYSGQYRALTPVPAIRMPEWIFLLCAGVAVLYVVVTGKIW
jgi:cobalt/nickel transport system permease protein